jgi:phage-related protein
MPDGRIQIDTKLDPKGAQGGFKEVQKELTKTNKIFKEAAREMQPYKQAINATEIAMIELARSSRTNAMSNAAFMEQVQQLGAEHKKATDAMLSNNSALTASFIQQAGYFMNATTHAENLRKVYEATNPAFAAFTGGALSAAAALQRFANSGSAAQLALETLGAQATAKELQTFTKVLNQNLAATPILAIAAAAAFVGLTTVIARAAYKEVPALREAIEEFRTTWGDALRPFITVWGYIFTAIVKAGTAIGQFFNYLNSLHPAITVIIFSIMYLATGIFLLLIPLGLMGNYIMGVRALMFTFARPLAAVSSLFASIGITALAVAAALVIVGAALWYLWNNNETFKNGVIAAWNAIKEAAAVAWNWIYTNIIQPILTQVWAFVKDIMTQLRVFWQQNGESIMQATGRVFGEIWKDISTILGFILALFKGVFPIISAVVSTAWNVIKAATQMVLSIFMNTVKMIAALINGDFAAANRAAGNIVRNMKDGVINIMESLISGVVRILGNLGAACYNGLANIVGYFSEAGGNFMRALADGITNGIGVVTGAVSDIASKIRNFLPSSPAKEGALKDLDKLNFEDPITLSIHKAQPKVAASMEHLFSLPQLQPLMNAMYGMSEKSGGLTVNQNVQFNNVENEQAFKRKLTQANRALAIEMQSI